ncbi:MAG: HlyD family efflux transporter periplasmic adaptor subunit [Synechococcaceae cyanobacterium SM2_3_2]|nr:HlyD family efflux transporter periplasmic adaptor subunit [Synechococcaceae cyanobacterium SM2_3_2]
MRAAVLITSGIVASLGLGIYGFNQFNLWGAQSQELNPQQEESLTPVVATHVGALGRIEPEGEVILVGGLLGERIGELLVSQGQRVNAGDPLARLESYRERQAERDYAASQLAEAELRLRAELAYAQSQITEAQTRIEQIDQPQSAQIRSQRATVRQLEIELLDALRNQERFESLYADGAVSQLELDQRQLTVQQAQQALNSAQASLSQIDQSRRLGLENAQAQLLSAEANLLRAQTSVQLQSLSRNLELAEARLERTIIRAPQAGQVLRIESQAGETISDNGGILELANTDQMMVVAEIYETDIGRVQMGQRAQITGSGFTESLSGVVDQVGLQIGRRDVLSADPAADVDVRVVEVKILLDAQSSQQVAGLTNMQVDVAIEL